MRQNQSQPKNEKPFAVADCETNPFRHGIPVTPFAWGFYTGSTYKLFWGDDCTAQFLAELASIAEPMIIYGHNAGKFDWLFLSKHFRGNIRIIGARIVQATIGIHEFRDSYANIPVPLSKFGGKTEIDYKIMEPFVRDKPGNRNKIEAYLKQDCVGLWHAVEHYRSMFGNALTMPSAAIKQLNIASTGETKGNVYEKMTPEQDAIIRPFFFGGRVECFSKGIVKNVGNITIYDVCSMYPAVMRNDRHPISAVFTCETVKPRITDLTDFVVCQGISHGAFPVRYKEGLRFPHNRGEFNVSGFEFRMAVGLGLFEPTHIVKTFQATAHTSFATFIEKFWNLRAQAKLSQNEMEILFYKLVMNSSYGKFAQNPDDYQDLIALPDGELPDAPIITNAEIHSLPASDPKRETAYRITATMPGVTIWGRKATNARNSFYNVGVAASITAAARAKLMLGLHRARQPFYCDTDSIISNGLENVEIGSNLGQWQLETTGDTLAIGGKKQYALFSNGKCVKSASKGVRLTPDEIYAIAQGREIEYKQDAPIMRMQARPKNQIAEHQELLFRNVRSTAFVERKNNHV